MRFCKRLGLCVDGDTDLVASAKIEDLIDLEFHNSEMLEQPTVKQVELAAKFGYDISNATKRVGCAVIADLMTELNLEAIEEQGLVPGCEVINRWDSLKRVEVISSIQQDGTVYLKGGNGKRAWARNLAKID